jgi:amino-acid N-acetyltransferase
LNPLGLHWERFWVAVDPSNQVIGCIQQKQHRDGSRELASLVVSPEWRKQGVAGALILNLLEDQQGDLYLMCRFELGDFYRRFGFAAVLPENMPPYFKRIWRLAAIFEVVTPGDEKLLVMCRIPANPVNGSG